MDPKRWMTLLAIIVLLTGGTVACGPTDDDDVEPGDLVEVIETDVPDVDDVDDDVADVVMTDGLSVDELMADPIGYIELGPDDPLEIGAMFVLSGANESLGVDSRDGVELAIDDAGPMKGHDILLTTEDSQCTAEGGQTAATRLAANEEIVGVIGTSCSGAAVPAIPIICEAGMVMISPSNTAPALTASDRDASFSCYLRTAHNDRFQGRVAAEFAYNQLGLTTAATIHDGSPYAEQLQSVFADVFQELGGTIAAQEAVNVNDTDMTPVLTSIAATTPQIIYYPIFTAEGGFITAQARQTTGLEDVVLMGADGIFSAEFVKAAGAAAEGMYLSGPYVGEGGMYDSFLASLRIKYDRGPLSGFHAHAYDATRILLSAIERASAETEDGGLIIGRQALRDAISGTMNHAGLTGNLSCDENGDCATGEALAVFQITADQISAPEDNWPPDVVYQP